MGTGFDHQTLRTVHQRLLPLAREDSPFAKGSPAGAGHCWVEPRLVCEVEFTEWTDDGGLRHPSFLGLRDDKTPEECRREQPAEAPAAPRRLEAPGFAVTNPDKVFWPDDGYTKSDLLDYYEAAAPLLLPYLRDRPLVLTRFPDGIHGKSFFQKDAPDYVPEWVATRRIYSKDADRDIDLLHRQRRREPALRANLGTIPLHIWGSRLDSLERPTGWCWTWTPRVRRSLMSCAWRGLSRACWRSWTSPATSRPRAPPGCTSWCPWAGATLRAVPRLRAPAGARRRAKNAGHRHRGSSAPRREGKVYIDFGQNGYGRTIAAPFSARPLPGRPSHVRCAGPRSRPGWTRPIHVEDRRQAFAKKPDPLLPVVDAPGIDMPAALAGLEALFGKR